jgi:predicted Fe-Mo cluster-binding NifX family protein
MITAVAAEGSAVDSPVSDMGARAPYYLLFEEGKSKEAIQNPFVIGGGGAAFSVAHLLAERGVTRFISGDIGPNMRDALAEKGITYKQAAGKTASEAVARQ